MAARRAAIFDQYAQWAADAYNEERFIDFLNRLLWQPQNAAAK
jgi:hypothetical protein